MNPIDKYTSTGCKLIHHPEVIRRLQGVKRGTPISLQIAPTSRCNLNCEFCSNSKRESHEDLDFDRLCSYLEQMKGLGAKTVEWTGGGDPTMYKHIDASIKITKGISLKQGLITNGLAINTLEKDTLRSLSWIRISMNGLDYGKLPTFPDRKYFKGTLGFSYVINNKTTPDVLKELDEIVKKIKPAYVRIVPNCLATKEQQVINNNYLSGKVEQMGKPYFYQTKVFKKPDFCYWYLFKPFLLHDGYVYPCSSVVLNDTADRQFHDKYRVCKMEDAYMSYEGPIIAHSAENCTHCVFCEQNQLIESILEPTGMESFV